MKDDFPTKSKSHLRDRWLREAAARRLEGDWAMEAVEGVWPCAAGEGDRSSSGDTSTSSFMADWRTNHSAVEIGG